MSFPVTVSSVTQSAEAPGRYGPFLIGTNRYEILITPIETDIPDGFWTPFFSALKSTDAGATWNEVDSADRPAGNETVGYGQPTPYCCCQSKTDPTKIFVFFTDPGSGQITTVIFDASVDLWGSILSDAPFSLLDGFPFIAADHREADNTVVFVFPQSTFTDASNETHIYPQAVIYDVASDTWGTPFDLGFTDYATVIGWHQVPCGVVVDSSGVTRVFMQQVTHAVPLGPLTLRIGDTVPWYGGTAEVDVWGGGGGGTGAADADAGGGGGAAAFASGSVALTPLSVITGSVGTGGAGGAWDPAGGATTAGSDGTGSSVLGVTAAGGDGAPTGGTGGGNGGQGFTTTTLPGGGGGGGGVDGPNGIGSAGGNGVIYDGTPGDPNGGTGGSPGPGIGGGGGGGGGTYDPTNLPGGEGGGGAQPGGGGGGGAGSGGGGGGGDGDYSITYFAVQGTVYPSRLWQQAILSDNSLGSLDEISDGEFPIQTFENQLVLMPFDSAAAAGKVAIAFSGAVATSGYTQVEVMSGSLADPISFSGTNFTTGGSIEPSPAVAIDSTGKIYCLYKQATSSAACSYLFRDSSTSFATANLMGTFDDPFCRLQAGVFSSIPEITFGTPSGSEASWIAPT